jgi:hypothetical protein
MLEFWNIARMVNPIFHFSLPTGRQALFHYSRLNAFIPASATGLIHLPEW